MARLSTCALLCLVCHSFGCETQAVGHEVHAALPLPGTSGKGSRRTTGSFGGGGGGGGSGPLHKRSVGWGLNATQIRELSGPAWWYNWGTRVGDSQAEEAAAAAGMRYVPMQWGRWGIDDLESNIQAGSSVVLGFNEPNHQLQAGMAPREAAELWPQLEAVADRLGLRLGAPAAAPCGDMCIEPDPFKYRDEFFFWCRDCRVDFLATHYYACNLQWLQSYLRQCRRYQRPIWLTEFACPNPGGADVTSWQYLVGALDMLDRDDWVERCAWYALDTYGWLGTSNSLMDMTTGKLTALGDMYLSYTPLHTGSGAARAAVRNATAGTSATGQGAAEVVADVGTSAAGRSGWEAGDIARAGASSDAGGGGGGFGSGSRGGGGGGGDGMLQGQGDADTWGQRCRPCIQHLRGGRRQSAMPSDQQRYCGMSCGFWGARAAAREPAGFSGDLYSA